MLSLDNPALDWVSLAKGMGVEAVRVTTIDAFADAFRVALVDDRGMHNIHSNFPFSELGDLSPTRILCGLEIIAPETSSVGGFEWCPLHAVVLQASVIACLLPELMREVLSGWGPACCPLQCRGPISPRAVPSERLGKTAAQTKLGSKYMV